MKLRNHPQLSWPPQAGAPYDPRGGTFVTNEIIEKGIFKSAQLEGENIGIQFEIYGKRVTATIESGDRGLSRRVVGLLNRYSDQSVKDIGDADIPEAQAWDAGSVP